MPTLGIGTLLKRGDGGNPETFTTVPNVKSISGPSTENDEVDITTHSSTGGYREFVTTLSDPGTVEFDMIYEPTDTQHIGIRTDFNNKTKRNWQIVLPGAAQTISFAAYVQAMPLEFPTDDVITMKVTLRLSGPPTFS